jgi:hypothetical protein
MGYVVSPFDDVNGVLYLLVGIGLSKAAVENIPRTVACRATAPAKSGRKSALFY